MRGSNDLYQRGKEFLCLHISILGDRFFQRLLVHAGHLCCHIFQYPVFVFSQIVQRIDQVNKQKFRCQFARKPGFYPKIIFFISQFKFAMPLMIVYNPLVIELSGSYSQTIKKIGRSQ